MAVLICKYYYNNALLVFWKEWITEGKELLALVFLQVV